MASVEVSVRGNASDDGVVEGGGRSGSNADALESAVAAPAGPKYSLSDNHKSPKHY